MVEIAQRQRSSALTEEWIRSELIRGKLSQQENSISEPHPTGRVIFPPLSWPCTDIEQEFFEGREADFTPLGSCHGALLHDLTHSSDSAGQVPSM